ncbi:hypothetical protein ACH4U6_21095 [Streptomyces netropsis]|uniref:hypothetical protein n=1 Tax=Streptomyces netropsis TaxID=55404 RepID=UPI0037ACB910
MNEALNSPENKVDDGIGQEELLGFEEIENPEADVVSMGDASYTKMLGRIWS